MIDFFRYLFRPSYWLSQYPVCKVWDEKLNYMMDNGFDVKRVDGYTVIIGDYEIWVTNFPFAYGKDWTVRGDFLPKRRTRERLAKYIQTQRYNKKG